VRRRTLTLGTTRGTYRRSTLSLSIRCAILSIASILALELSTLRAKADELPKFSDAEVNQFVSQYADLVTKYIQAYQAAKAGNPSAFDQLKTQVKQLQDEVAKVAEKLKTKPDEAQKYEQFIANYTEKMIDATN
jgi:septal ring factor EnvC (AmiA/AmiB activator)